MYQLSPPQLSSFCFGSRTLEVLKQSTRWRVIKFFPTSESTRPIKFSIRVRRWRRKLSWSQRKKLTFTLIFSHLHLECTMRCSWIIKVINLFKLVGSLVIYTPLKWVLNEICFKFPPLSSIRWPQRYLGPILCVLISQDHQAQISPFSSSNWFRIRWHAPGEVERGWGEKGRR